MRVMVSGPLLCEVERVTEMQPERSRYLDRFAALLLGGGRQTDHSMAAKKTSGSFPAGRKSAKRNNVMI